MNDLSNLATQTRKPRMALMGEFSAGKSTLSNLMLGMRPLPERVTATQLPPVWLAYGDEDPFREDLDGVRHPVDISDLESVPLQSTLYIKIYLETDILQLCDLIDMPGISDPNMPPAVWERMSGHADGVIWCTHATQAWRQSEAAVWDAIPAEVQQQSMLLVTRIDKVLNDRDRKKLLRRVRAEVDGKFLDVFPVSLLAATQAGDNWEAWNASGAEAFTDCLIDVLSNIEVADDPRVVPFVQPESRSEPLVLADPVESAAGGEVPETKVEATPAFDAVAAFEADVDDYIFDDAFEDEKSDDEAAVAPVDEQTEPEIPRSEVIDFKQPVHEQVAAQSEPEEIAVASSNVVMPRRVRRTTNEGDETSGRPATAKEIARERLEPLADLPNLRDVFSLEGNDADGSNGKLRVAGR